MNPALKHDEPFRSGSHVSGPPYDAAALVGRSVPTGCHPYQPTTSHDHQEARHVGERRAASGTAGSSSHDFLMKKSRDGDQEVLRELFDGFMFLGTIGSNKFTVTVP